jgi:hypothetical protein
MGLDCSAAPNLDILCNQNSWCAISIGQTNWASGASSTCIGNSNKTCGSWSVAIGGNNNAWHSDGNCVAIGNQNDVSMNNGIAIGYDNTSSGGIGSTAIGYECVAGGAGGVAMGRGCSASGDYSVAMGSGADASGTGGFVYRSNAGNTFVFDDASPPSLKINGSAVGSAAALSLRVAYSFTVSQAQTLTAITFTFPSLPNDNRLVSVTAWTMGNGTNCGGGVTFNIPSSELRTWYWGIWVGGSNVFRLWNSSDAQWLGGTQEGFSAAGPGAAMSNAGGGVGGATHVSEWSQPGGVGGAFASSGKVPGAASTQPLYTATPYSAGIKVQWIG